MAHKMAHISIPHTIKRGKTYYFNRRIDNQWVRLSLNTQSSRIALNIVSTILELTSNVLSVKKLNPVKLKELVQAVKEGKISNAKALLYTDSEEAIANYERYSNYQFRLINEHSRYDQIPYEYSSNLVKPPPVKDINEYNLDRLQSSNSETSEEVAKILNQKLNLRNNPDYLDVISSVDFIKAEAELTVLINDAKRLRELIESGQKEEAKHLLNLLMGLKPESSQSKDLSHEKNLDLFENFVNKFLDAGQNGELSKDKRNNKKPWSFKIFEDQDRKFAVFSSILGKIPLNKVTGKDLDQLFSEVIFNLPKGNIKPYCNMSIEERVNYAQSGNVEPDDLISGKTAYEYLKSLQSFYAWLYKEHVVDVNPLDNMRNKIRFDKVRRGAFSKSQVHKMVNYCEGLTKSDQKWPVIIMSLTGMRNTEIMQLRKDDIKKCKDTGITYFDITGDAGSVKTESSQRKVPVHNKLIEMGFLEYVKQVTGKKLFDRDGKYLTSFYSGTLKKQCAIPEVDESDDPLSLYSLRHFVVTRLQGANTNLALTQQLVGHRKSQSITDVNYTHQFTLNELKEAIENVKYW